MTERKPYKLEFIPIIAEKLLDTHKDADGKCSFSKVTTSSLELLAYGLTNNGLLFTGYPVVGYQNKMQAWSGCAFGPEDGLLTSCPWDPRIKGLFFHQTTVSIPLDRVKEFILDMQKLRDLQPDALCGLELYDGVWMRYVKASSAYLGKDYDVLDFDFTYYRQVACDIIFSCQFIYPLACLLSYHSKSY
jgi:L-gulonolactone oxidase